MDHFKTGCVVIGAGVVGLACAARLAQAGHEVIVLEAADRIGTGVSSRNSGLIHAGLYYPQGSLKARLCVAGRQRLYEWCERHHVAHRRCGKLVVAMDEAEAGRLNAIGEKAIANGAGTWWADGQEVRRLEPALPASVEAALVSPETGIVDVHELMTSLEGVLIDHGGRIAFGARVSGADLEGGGLLLRVGTADGEMALQAPIVVNAAGLGAVGLARTLPGAERITARSRFAKGHYFRLAGKQPFSRLIYPVPVDGGLGVHLTLDLAGKARFGPDVEWLPEGAVEPFDYRVDPSRLEAFAAAIRHYWPQLDAARLAPDFAGIRPKLSGPGGPAADFSILGEADHGIGGLVHLLGIESPGLTACLAIAEAVAVTLNPALT